MEKVGDRSPRLLGYGVMLTGSVPDAEDLLHDAIVKAFGRPRRFEHVNAAEQYVRRTMQTLAIDRHRSRSAFQRALDRDAPPAATSRDSDAALDVEAALANLSPQERASIVLRYYADLTVPEVARQLGLADGTVKRYLSNAFAKLATVIPADPTWGETPEKIAVTSKGARA